MVELAKCHGLYVVIDFLYFLTFPPTKIKINLVQGYINVY